MPTSEINELVWEKSAFVGFCVVDTDGNIISSNPKMCEVLEYTKEELDNLNMNDIIVPEDRERIKSILEVAKKEEVESYAITLRYLTKSGQIKWSNVKMDCTMRKHGSNTIYTCLTQSFVKQEGVLNIIKSDESANTKIWNVLKAVFKYWKLIAAVITLVTTMMSMSFGIYRFYRAEQDKQTKQIEEMRDETRQMLELLNDMKDN